MAGENSYKSCEEKVKDLDLKKLIGGMSRIVFYQETLLEAILEAKSELDKNTNLEMKPVLEESIAYSEQQYMALEHEFKIYMIGLMRR